MTYIFEVATLPTKDQQVPSVIVRGSAADEREARIRLAEKLSQGTISRAASLIANQASQSWTDFPEAGVMARVMPR